MTIYYLMIKTHNKTGLKYLCQTKQKDPYSYLGSGEDWKKHRIKHGNDIHTDILLSTSDREEMKSTGRYLSRLLNVVGAMDDFGNKIYANKIPETGGGPGFTSEERKFYSNKPESKKKFVGTMNEPTVIKKRTNSRNITINSSEFKVKFKETMSDWRNSLTAEEVEEMLEKQRTTKRSVAGRKRNSDAQKIAQNRPDVAKQKSDAQKITQNKPEVKALKSGFNNYRYDKTVRMFYHTDGTEISCTSGELSKMFNLDRGCISKVINGVHSQIKGWKVKLIS